MPRFRFLADDSGFTEVIVEANTWHEAKQKGRQKVPRGVKLYYIGEVVQKAPTADLTLRVNNVHHPDGKTDE